MSAMRPAVPAMSYLPTSSPLSSAYAYTIDEPSGWSLPSDGSVPTYRRLLAASTSRFHAPELSTGIVSVTWYVSYAGTALAFGITAGRVPRSTLPYLIASGLSRSIPTK